MESMGVYFIFNKKKLQYVHKLPMTKDQSKDENCDLES